MAVNENVGTYSTTAASNTPAGTDNVGPDLDNHLRDIKKNIRVTAENAKGPSSPASSFTGRFWVDTARSASTSLTLKLHDYEGFVSVFDMDTSANAMTSANFANSAIALAQIDFNSDLGTSSIPLSNIDFQSDLTASSISRTFIDIPDSSIPRNSLSLVGQIDTTDLSASAVTSAKIDSDAVTTGKIADDAVTLAKMASGTASKLIGYDGSGNPAEVDGVSAASQAQMEAASATDVYVSPGRAKHAPGAAKAWCYVTVAGGTPTLAANHNVASIDDDGAGDFGVNFTTAMSSANYAVIVSAYLAGGNRSLLQAWSDSRTTASVELGFSFTSTNGLGDPTHFDVVVYGDFA